MPTIVLGFPDAEGRGKPTLIAGQDVDSGEQCKIVEAATRNGKWPKNIQRLEVFYITPKDRAIKAP